MPRLKNYNHFEWLKANEEKIVELVVKWADINTHTHNIDGLNKFRNLLAGSFAPLGGYIEHIPMPAAIAVNEKGEKYQQEIGCALFIKKWPDAPIQILFGGHMDTVYPVDSHFQKCVRLSNAILNGPGVADMKGGLAIMLSALHFLEQSEYAGKIGWEVVVNADEEIGSPSSSQLYQKAAEDKHFGLLFEPAINDGEIAGQRSGSVNLNIIASGIRAHAGRDYHKGSNAINTLIHYLVSLESSLMNIPSIRLNVGKISGGEALNVIPDKAIASINARMDSSQDLEYFLQAIENAKTPAISIHMLNQRPPKLFDKKTQQLFSALQACAKEIEEPLEIKATGGVCDGNNLSAIGLPVIDNLGGIGGNIHTDEEYLIISSLTHRSQLLAIFLSNLAENGLE